MIKLRMEIKSTSLVMLIFITMVGCAKQNLADTPECKRVMERKMEIARRKETLSPPGATVLEMSRNMLRNDEIHKETMAEIEKLNTEYAAKCEEK
jgi:hypothetical protein